MTGCPALEMLRLFLDERLDEPDLQRVMAHLETCDLCQCAVHKLLHEPEAGEPDGGIPSTEISEGRTEREILESLAKNVPQYPTLRSRDATPTEIVFPGPRTPEAPLGQLDSYQIQQEIGSGNYGIVFKAYDEKLGRIVALKVLRPELAVLPGARTRFESEARAAAKVNNPHVIVIYGVFDGTPSFPCPYIAMEFVDGVSLHAFLRARPQGLEPKEAARLAQQAARGLAAAHARGVVHRDVKPDNILLCGPEGERQVKITDFGIAQVLEADVRRSTQGSIIGTPHYMSPEAFLSPHAVDGRSDIYSLGVSLYQLLTGRLPIAVAGAEQILRRVLMQQFASPRHLNPKVPADLEAIVLKCMAKDPAGRYETSAELAEQLGRWLQGEPVADWRYNSRDLLKLWYRRNRKTARWAAAFSLSFAALLLTVAFDVRMRQEDLKAQLKIVNDYGNSAETQQRDGRFGEAAVTLDQAIAILNGRPGMAVDLLKQFEARRDRLKRLDEFMRSADNAWFFAGEERGGATLVACEKALGCFGVLDRSDWERPSALSDFPAELASQVRGEIHRLLLLLAAMRIEHGILALNRLQFGALPDSARSALAILERARDLERTRGVTRSKTTDFLERGASRLLNATRPLPGTASGPGAQATISLMDHLSAEDGFFLGVIHVYLAKHQKDPLARGIKLLGPREFDYEHPRQTAADMLRLAVRLEPRNYWSCFMLGRILAFPDPEGGAEYREALQVFNTCVSLRPDYSRGYEQRALCLVRLSLEASTPERRASLREQAGADLERALGLAPEDPSTHWVRGQAFELLRDIPKAVAAYTCALELEHGLQEKVSRRNQLKGIEDLVNHVLEENPADHAARRLSALIARSSTP